MEIMKLHGLEQSLEVKLSSTVISCICEYKR
jgi:hypothetical protein